MAAAKYGASACAVALLVTAALVLNISAGLVTFTGWSNYAIGVAVLCALGTFYSFVVGRPRVAEAAFFIALWTPFNIAGGILSYLAATTALPLMDTALSRFDEVIGFDWVAWVSFVRSYPTLNSVLRTAYDSLMVQLLCSIAVFAALRVHGRNEELMLAACAAAILTTVMAALLPALGPWVHFGQGALFPSDTAYVAHVLALRQEAAPSFALNQLKGIVTFPSFHTTLALLFTYAHRGIGLTLPAFAVLNCVMLLSVPSEGGHHLADMLGGAAVAVAAVILVRGFQCLRGMRSALGQGEPP